MRLPIIFLTIAVMVAMGQKSKDDVSKIGDRNVGNCLNFYSLEKEIALGKQLAEEVARQSKLYLDPIVEEKINRIGQNLVRNSDSKLPFTFRVVDDDVPNAFALPGGFVFVNTGLIKLASEESELAGAMAHEVAHVAARHMTCQATKSQIAAIAATAGGVLPRGWPRRVCRAAGGGRRYPDRVPETQPRRGDRSGLFGYAIHVCCGVRSERRDQHLREDGVATEEEGGSAGPDLFYASDGRRSDRQNAKGNPADSARQVRVCGEHIGVHGRAGPCDFAFENDGSSRR